MHVVFMISLQVGQRGDPGEPHLRKFPQTAGSLPSPMCFKTLLHLPCLLRHLKAQHTPLCKSKLSTGTQVILEIYQLTASLRGQLCSSKQPSLIWELCLHTTWVQVFHAYLLHLGKSPQTGMSLCYFKPPEHSPYSF